MDEMMTLIGSCRLLIYGDNINLNEIEKILNLKATRTAEKGKPVLTSFGTPISRVCQTNGWFYVVEFSSEDDLSNTLGLLLSKIYPRKDELKMLAERYEDTDIFISISVSSDYAQMSFKIEPEHQKLIAEMGFPLYFSIFSFGLVESGEYEEDDIES